MDANTDSAAERTAALRHADETMTRGMEPHRFWPSSDDPDECGHCGDLVRDHMPVAAATDSAAERTALEIALEPIRARDLEPAHLADDRVREERIRRAVLNEVLAVIDTWPFGGNTWDVGAYGRGQVMGYIEGLILEEAALEGGPR